MNPSYLTFIEEMRATGAEVIDVFVPHDGFSTFGQWADALMQQELAHHRDGVPLHLLGYCLGGTLLTVIVRGLEDRGIRPDYVGFIDVRRDTPAVRLSKGLDALYGVPLANRIRLQLLRLTPPDREPLGVVVGSILRRSVRSIVELPTRGWRSRKRRNPLIHGSLRLNFSWEYRSITSPVHCYNCALSIERHPFHDPSLGMSIRLRGGLALRLIEGTHENCIEPPHSAALIELITADRVSAMQGRGLLL